MVGLVVIFFPSKSCVRTNIFTDYRVILNYAPEKDDPFSKEDFLKVNTTDFLAFLILCNIQHLQIFEVTSAPFSNDLRISSAISFWFYYFSW